MTTLDSASKRGLSTSNEPHTALVSRLAAVFCVFSPSVRVPYPPLNATFASDSQPGFFRCGSIRVPEARFHACGIEQLEALK